MMQTANTTEPPFTDEKERLSQLKKHKCFATSAALTIEQDKTQKGTPTLSLQMAPATQGTADWSNKISIQLTKDELPVFVGVLLGYANACEFKRGQKGISFERQPENNALFARGTQKRVVAPLPITPGSVYHISALALAQLHAQSDELNPSLMLAGIRGASLLMPAKKRTPQ